MSSIAYVTDENMLEYHRLCGNKDINFWRLTTKASFKHFQKGDLLFFYAYTQHSKKKGFVGYGHFEESHDLTLTQMWKKYGTLNGYDSKEELEEAIKDASRSSTVPEKMNCLVLKDIIFFVSPVYPSEVGLKLSEKLESYTYIDASDPSTTARILRKAEEIGIDAWSSSQTFEPENIFAKDETAHILTSISKELGEEPWNTTDLRNIRSLSQGLLEKHYELIRGTKGDFYRVVNNELEIVVPFVYNSKNRNERIKDLLGCLTLYKLKAKEYNIPCAKVRIAFTSLKKEEDVERLVEELNRYE